MISPILFRSAPFYDLGVKDVEKDSDMIRNMKVLTKWSGLSLGNDVVSNLG